MLSKRLPLPGFDISLSFSPMKEYGFFIQHDLVPFENDATEFSVINAWWLMECSRLVYVTDQKYVKNILKNVGFNKIKFFDKSGTQCFIASNSKTIIVSVRGTEMNREVKDLIIDLNTAVSKSENHGYVHKGFKEALDYVWDDVKKYLLNIKTKNHKVWYTGHSLGAAIVTIMSARYSCDGVYTFGSPRVGTQKFINDITSPIYRIVNNRDIVTRIPPPIGFKHVGELKFISEKGKILTDPGFMKRTVQRLGGNEANILMLIINTIVFKSGFTHLLKYLNDHSPYNYSVLMWNNIEE